MAKEKIEKIWGKIPRAKIYLKPKGLAVLFLKILFDKPNNKEKIIRWESAFKGLLGLKNALILSRARLALYYLLKNLNLPKDSELIMTPLTIADMVNAVIWAGLKPVFCDHGERTYNIDYSDLERKITPKTKVLLVTHLNGFATDMDKVLEITKKHNLILLEDASQGAGATFDGKFLGTFGAAGIFSLSFMKTTCTLFGGMIVSDDSDLIERIKNQTKDLPPMPKKTLLKEALKNFVFYFSTNRLIFSLFGYYFIKFSDKIKPGFVDRLTKSNPLPALTKEPPKSLLRSYTDPQAELGLKLLENIKISDDKRIENANCLLQNLSPESLKHAPILTGGSKNLFWRMPFQTGNPENFKNYLLKNGIDCARTNLILATEEKVFTEYYSDTPNAKKSKEAIFIPMHSDFSQNDMLFLAQKINNYF